MYQLPSKFLSGLGCVAEQSFDLGRTIVHRIDLDADFAVLIGADFGLGFARPGDLQVDFGKRTLHKLTNSVRFAYSCHKETSRVSDLILKRQAKQK